MNNIVAVDFETETIKNRPDYPPKPVGVAITEPGLKSKYWAWGHPCENNCTKEKAAKILKDIWFSGKPVIAHNYKFDGDVANTFFNLPLIPKGGFHDTEFLAFLHNPHEALLGLKPLAAKYLDMPPEERDRVSEWVQDHVFLSRKFKDGDFEVVVDTKKPKGWFKVPPTKTGAFIYLAPGKLAGTYACGDTIRTYKLFKLFYKYVKDHGMLGAYQRELDLMPVLLTESERGGLKLAVTRLQRDASKWNSWIEESDNWIRRYLKAPDLSIDSGEELADALEASGKVDNWIYTDSGKRSTSKDNIEKCIDDPTLLQVLGYRARLVNSYRNFAKPWCEIASRNDNRVATNWHQVRGEGFGARTGRLASSPNLQNVPKKPAVVVATKAEQNKLMSQEIESVLIPKTLFNKVGQLPVLRDYVIPDEKSHILLNRDINSQEIRILAHFEDGVLMRAFKKDHRLDMHQLTRELVNNLLGAAFKRGPIKTINFGLIYGQGIGSLAKRLGLDVETTKRIKDAVLDSYPGLKDLIKELRQRARDGEPLRTWGGREYYVEPPKIVKGRIRTFEYKLLNVLIQGSAADDTKQVMLNYYNTKKEGRLVLNVHDELMLSCPKGAAKEEMRILKEAIADVDFDVPMLSDGKSSAVSWARMKPWKD